MIIQHNIAAINSYRNLGINQSGLNKNLEKLSSGYRINRAGDDAAGLAISESMRSQINGLNQATKNAQDAVGLIQTVEGALTETHSMLQRLTTLASQSANGTYNSVARGNLQLEVDQLLKEIDRIANYTDFNGIKPIANDVGAGKMTFQIGPSAKETILVDKQAMTASFLGLTAAGNLKTDKAAGTTVNTAWAKATSSTAVNVSTQTGGNLAIDRINDAINLVSQYRAGLGAAQNRLEHTINNLKVTSENITAAESRIRDTDMADEITAFTKNNILLQASQSMLAQSNSVPQSILSLIG
ncbi:MAG: flagellin [Lachnospiraceae bacterium]|jgi:flagellin|nr:flagellin [Lachnospiraceae bacterium]